MKYAWQKVNEFEQVTQTSCSQLLYGLRKDKQCHCSSLQNGHSIRLFPTALSSLMPFRVKATDG